MPRKRMIDPSIWADSDFQRLPPEARLLFIAHVSLMDDEFRGTASAADFKTIVFPRDNDIDEEEVERLMDLLGLPKWRKRLPLILYYEAGGDRYYFVPRASRHQYIQRPSPSSLPPPPEDRYAPQGAPDSREVATGIAGAIIESARRREWTMVEGIFRNLPAGIFNATAAALRRGLMVKGQRIRGVEGWVEYLKVYFEEVEEDDEADRPGDQAGGDDPEIEAGGAPDRHPLGNSEGGWDLAEEAGGGGE